MQCDESKIFTVLLIIKLPFLNLDILCSDSRKPFYKECLMYIICMVFMTNDYITTLNVFSNMDERKQHHSHLVLLYFAVCLVSLMTVWVRFSDGFSHFASFLNIVTSGTCSRLVVPRLYTILE